MTEQAKKIYDDLVALAESRYDIFTINFLDKLVKEYEDEIYDLKHPKDVETTYPKTGELVDEFFTYLDSITQTNTEK